MELTVTIKAPELARAIEALAESIKVIQFKPMTWMDEYDLRQKSEENKRALKPEEPTVEDVAKFYVEAEPLPEVPTPREAVEVKQPVAEDRPDPEPKPHTRDDLMDLCGGILDADPNKGVALCTLLSDYNVQSIPALPDDKIEEVYERVVNLF